MKKPKQSSPKFPEFVAVKMTTKMRRAVERAAGDRSVMQFLRELIEHALLLGIK